jgi:hypothetical protein
MHVVVLIVLILKRQGVQLAGSGSFTPPRLPSIFPLKIAFYVEIKISFTSGMARALDNERFSEMRKLFQPN